jgi:uncharacterized protein YkwD
LRSNQNLRAAVRASYPRLAAHLRRHRAITRLSLAGLALAVALGVSMQDAAAGIPRPTVTPASILPQSIGAGIMTTDPVTITFDRPMDTAAVDGNLQLEPVARFQTSWNSQRTSLTVSPLSRWQTDQRYVLTFAGIAANLGGRAGAIGTRQVTFTTQTAPTISEFRVHLAQPARADAAQSTSDLSRSIPFGDANAVLGDLPLIDTPEDTTDDASSNTGIRLGFASPMDRADVESRFHISPGVRGAFSWDGDSLTFTPRDRLEPGTRYAVSVVGAHDLEGNRLAGDVSFSFTTRTDAEVVSFSPDRHASGVTSRHLTLRFSQPMNVRETRQALRVVDVDAGRRLGGSFEWNDRHTRLDFTFRRSLPKGHTIEVRLTRAARDMDGNRLTVSWRFETKAPPRPAPAAASTVAPPLPSGPNAPAGTLDYALWLINQSRADYGFAPLRLDSAISAVASAHAWDQINYNYFSHTGRDGSQVSDRLRAAGISFGWSGENMCYYNGMGVRAMLDWCHNTFMSEPYPGVANHIGNILSPHYNRVGIGIAQSGGKVIIVWDFAG